MKDWVVTGCFAAAIAVVAAAGYRIARWIEAKIDTMQVPADAVDLEIERLRARVAALERKAAKAEKPPRQKKAPAEKVK